MSSLLRPIVVSDLDAVVAVHRAAFPGFLMTLLGRRFLHGYYETVLDCDTAIFIGQFEDGLLSGFVAGFKEPHKFYSLLAKRKPKLLLAAAVHLAVRPGLWLRVLENSGAASERAQVSGPTEAELASVAVSPGAQGRGFGRALVRAFVREAAARGVTVVHLTTDADGNEGVNRLYVSSGFACVDTTLRAGGRRMNHYSKPIAGAAHETFGEA